MIKGTGQTITLPQGQYISIRLLGSGSNGDQIGNFRINYTDATYTDISLTEKDWCTTNTTGERIAQTMAHRHRGLSDQTVNAYVYAYYLTPLGGKTVASLGLPNNGNMHLLAITLASPISGTPTPTPTATMTPTPTPTSTVTPTSTPTPTPISGSDSFNSGTLGSQWSWIREDNTKWSLTANPGYMRIITQSGDLMPTTNNMKNILLQTPSTSDFTVITKLTISAIRLIFNQAGLVVYSNDDNYVMLQRFYGSSYSPANEFMFKKEIGGTVTKAYIGDTLGHTILPENGEVRD